jgi:hypothetical protein
MPAPGELIATAPPLGAGLAGAPWWVVLVLAAMTIFLYGAEPAMRWLDVLERLRTARTSRNETHGTDRAG